MATTYSQIQTEACSSGVGKLTNQIQLLQAFAQASIDYLQAVNPSLDVSLSAIRTRACNTGIGDIQDQRQLLVIIAQLLNDQQS